MGFCECEVSGALRVVSEFCVQCDRGYLLFDVELERALCLLGEFVGCVDFVSLSVCEDRFRCVDCNGRVVEGCLVEDERVVSSGFKSVRKSFDRLERCFGKGVLRYVGRIRRLKRKFGRVVERERLEVERLRKVVGEYVVEVGVRLRENVVLKDEVVRLKLERDGLELRVGTAGSIVGSQEIELGVLRGEVERLRKLLPLVGCRVIDL